YSTTFAARRTARRTWRRTHVNGEERPALDAFGRPDDTDETVIIPTWRYHSSGYTNNGDRWLASMAADQARSRREVARDHRSAA
ncbi:replication initiator, partial [Frankia sp. BMG5.23]|uniref:replication initiator n=1 Tax=Frankia sp. BMG5.23 TaxID=683305 RepID=UPI000460E65F